MREEREYISDDIDISPNKLTLFQGENGDWYLSIKRIDERIGKSVRITTSGGCHEVIMAIYNLYEALEKDKRPVDVKGWMEYWKDRER